MIRTINVCYFCALLIVATGCGDTGPAKYPVSGTVTFNGEPLADGQIAFRDTKGEIPSAGGKITNGNYAFEMQPGEMIVTIEARRDIPGKFSSPAPGEKYPVTEQYLPEKYNTKSELKQEVVEEDNVFNFELTGHK